MKKVILISVLLTIIICSLFGCSNSIQNDETYHCYTYDLNSHKFLKYGPSITFNNNLSGYSFDYGDGSIVLKGSVQKLSSPESLIITCNEDAVAVLKAKYRANLIASGADDLTIEAIDLIMESLDPKQQLFIYDGKLFADDGIELTRKIDSETYNAKTNYSTFEGEFTLVSDNSTVYMSSNGKMYTAAEDGKYTVQSGYYTVRNGFMTITTTDSSGNDKYVDGLLYSKRYFMATISFPTNIEIISTDFDELTQNSDWYSTFVEQIELYQGKTISVLVDSFYTYKSV